MKQYVLFGVLVVVVAGGVMQFRNQGLSRLLRKTEDVSGDHRKLSDAFTGSRQGLINESMRDFAQNPVLGQGFQVAEYMQRLRDRRRNRDSFCRRRLRRDSCPR